MDTVTVEETTVSELSDGRIVINVQAILKNGAKQTVNYTVNGNGVITVESSIDASKTSMTQYYQKIGTDLILPEGFENVSWYGNGPVENYIDRNGFANVGCTATLYQICSIRMLSLKTQEILRVYAG